MLFGSITANAVLPPSSVSHGDWHVFCGFTQLDMFFWVKRLEGFRVGGSLGWEPVLAFILGLFSAMCCAALASLKEGQSSIDKSVQLLDFNGVTALTDSTLGTIAQQKMCQTCNRWNIYRYATRTNKARVEWQHNWLKLIQSWNVSVWMNKSV